MFYLSISIIDGLQEIRTESRGTSEFVFWSQGVVVFVVGFISVSIFVVLSVETVMYFTLVFYSLQLVIEENEELF